jgi:hypothetical protein
MKIISFVYDVISFGNRIIIIVVWVSMYYVLFVRLLYPNLLKSHRPANAGPSRNK